MKLPQDFAVGGSGQDFDVFTPCGPRREFFLACASGLHGPPSHPSLQCEQWRVSVGVSRGERYSPSVDPFQKLERPDPVATPSVVHDAAKEWLRRGQARKVDALLLCAGLGDVDVIHEMPEKKSCGEVASEAVESQIVSAQFPVAPPLITCYTVAGWHGAGRSIRAAVLEVLWRQPTTERLSPASRARCPQGCAGTQRSARSAPSRPHPSLRA